MRDLVARWQAGGGGPQGLVERALAHIKTGDYYYTLLPPALGDNPADEFFFETRRGYCEHYASAFALLMRVAGIPARVVVGYQGGELSTVGNWYLVTQSDAHAWTEVWLSGRGWVRVDPTAAVAPQRIERGGLLDRLANRAPVALPARRRGGPGPPGPGPAPTHRHRWCGLAGLGGGLLPGAPRAHAQCRGSGPPAAVRPCCGDAGRRRP